MNWSALLSLIVTISFHYASCEIERTPTEGKQYDKVRSSDAYWQSWLSPEGVVWYPGHVDYRKNEKVDSRYIDETVEPDGSHPNSRRYYTIEKEPQFLSEYKQQNAAQTGLQKSDKSQYELPHYGYETDREYLGVENQQNTNFGQNQYYPVLNRDPSGQIHYGDYFLNGQRVPKHPDSDLQTHFGHFDRTERDKVIPNHNGDIQYVPGPPSRLNQDSYYEMNHNGAAMVEQEERYHLPDLRYPHSQLPAYDTENGYHGSHHQVPPGEGYLPYGQDYYYENRQHYNTKDGEGSIQETPNGQYPSEIEKHIGNQPDNFYGHFIHAGEDGLPAPNKEVNHSTMEGEQEISPIEVTGNRPVSTSQPDKNLKPYRHGEKENRRAPEGREKSHSSKKSPLPDHQFVRKEAQTNTPSYERNGRTESLSKRQQLKVTKKLNIFPPTQQVITSQGKYPNSRHIKNKFRNRDRSKETAAKERLVTVPTVDIKFKMFQPDVSNKEEIQHIHNETHDHNSRNSGHNSRFQHNEQQNLHHHRNNTQQQTNSHLIYSTRDNITNHHHGRRRKTTNQNTDNSHSITQKRKGHQSNFKRPSIRQHTRPSLQKEDSTSVQQATGDRTATFHLGMTNSNSKTGSHINQHYDHRNQHLTDANHRQLSNPNLFVGTYDRYAPFESSSEFSALKDRKQTRRKQHIPHRSFDNHHGHTSRRKQTNNREPGKSVPGIAQRNTCPSVSQCRCCRWSTQQTERTVKCLQPKYKQVEVEVCIEENNGVCVRTGKQQTLEPNGSEIRMCSKVQLRRSCHVCCPSHYPVGNKTTCTGILDGIDKTGLRISISADEGQIEYARLPKNYQPRRRHNTQHNGRDRSRNGVRTRHQSRRRVVRRPRSVAV
ncbi:uncharacterized protein LOC106882314 [Octopus bimaculoides]|uniref:Uncharacterized protein n=1 Tax=Octopus bimaculoides TaxID=37653 RepID=A0A0L8FMZ2_OCTBM|nr:uncharacterized protein LOC106882314 [Octopus bimaculoides]|eukprot:XP_014788433.1 PREDICTED: uncharacterized protein LOC106882314 [Octopus bimaculoides]